VRGRRSPQFSAVVRRESQGAPPDGVSDLTQDRLT